jgi:hypothetical protein
VNRVGFHAQQALAHGHGGIHLGASHQREPQSGSGYWFQHFNNLLSFSNLPLGGGFVMRNVSAMGVAPCT